MYVRYVYKNYRQQEITALRLNQEKTAAQSVYHHQHYISFVYSMQRPKQCFQLFAVRSFDLLKSPD